MLETKNINLADNLFVLSIKVRCLSDILLLDADSGLYLDETFREMDFISRASEELLGLICENTTLVDRDDLLYSFFDTINRYLNLLSGLEQGRFCFTLEENPEIRERILAARKTAENQRDELKELLAASPGASGDPRVVSYAELNELLKGM